MVAHSGNSAVSTANTHLPTNNYPSATFKMNLPQNLCMYFVSNRTTMFEEVTTCLFSSFRNLVHPIDSWTKSDVQKWIEYCIDEYSLGDVNLNDFEMNGTIIFITRSIFNQIHIFSFSFIYQGKALLLLNEDSFKQRSPRSGDVLYKALQQHRATLKTWQCQRKNFASLNTKTKSIFL